MTRDVIFRPAHKAECRVIAELYRISSDGVADYIWTRLAQPGEDPLDVGARRYARESTDFSYENVTLALCDGNVAGMMAAYTMGPRERTESEFDFDVDPVLAPFDVLEQPNSYYISGVAVFPQYRGRAIGTRFMERAVATARERGLPQVSLIVFEENTGAKRLYDRLGFRVAMRECVVPHPLLHFGGDALLMVKDV
jgi:ribosomal protein S18 acetylase RimI-like enzyme